jgi:peptidase E
MTKYILHGGFSRKDNDSNRTFFSELVSDVPDGGTVLLVYFASEPGDDFNLRFNNHKQQITSHQAQDKSLHFVLANETDFISQVQKADAIYFNGGDTNILLTALRKYLDLKELLNGKTVAGSSAGAYALAEYGTAHSGEHARKGLGLLPVRVVCHYESSELPPSETSLEEIGKMGTELELVFLKDYEWRVFKV